MKDQLEEIRRRAIAELTDDAAEAQIDAVRVRVLGRSGELTEIMRRMREVPNEEKPLIGRLVNEIKAELEARIAVLVDAQQKAAMDRALA
jgi:phenylalanyl-tRNA synthetase alpha chain